MLSVFTLNYKAGLRAFLNKANTVASVTASFKTIDGQCGTRFCQTNVRRK